MNKKEQKVAVPLKRFPEFNNAGPWTRKPLADHIEEYCERASSTTQIEVYSSTREGLKPQNEYYDGRNLANEGDYGVVPDGYFVYRHMSDDDVFKFNLNQLGKKIAVSKEYPVFRTIDLNARFLLNHLNDGEEFKRFAISQKKGGTRTRLYLSALRTFESFLPGLDEQKKIADLLSSADVLINVHSQKLIALRDYKDGLLQRLFPIKGESIPKFRFPEFCDGGDWKIYDLGQLLREHPEYGINAPAVPYSDELPRYLRITDISESGEIKQDQKASIAKDVSSDNYLERGDIVIARTGASVGKSYRYREADGALVVAGFLIRVRPDPKKLSSKLLSQFLASDLYWHWVALTSIRSGQPGLNGNEIAKLPIPLPPTLSEQQKVADCLTSVDKIISGQASKVATLKSHKMALIHKVFPSVDEVVNEQ